MGLFGSSKPKVADAVTWPVGPWLSRTRHDVPFLSPLRLVNIATASAVLRASVDSRTNIMPEGRTDALASALRARDSLLTFDNIGAGATSLVTLGTLRHNASTSIDWTLAVDWQGDEASGGVNALASVPSYTTINGSMANEQSLRSLKSKLASTLAVGPELSVRSGCPELDNVLKTIRLDSASSPFAGGHVLPVVGHPKRWSLPVSSAELAQVCARLRYVVADNDGAFVVMLAPNGSLQAGSLKLEPSPQGFCTLTSRTVDGDVPMIEAHRWTRRLAMLFSRIKLDKEMASRPGLDSALDAIVREVEGPVTNLSDWRSCWSDQVLSPSWLMETGVGTVPVAVRIRGTAVDWDSCGMAARASVGMRLHGYKRNPFGRKVDLMYCMRPAQLVNDQRNMQRSVRYVVHTDLSSGSSGFALGSLPSFWEFSWRPNEDGSEVMCYLTGISRTENLIAYGEELRAYLDAFCDLVLSYDRGAEFTTVYAHL